MRRLIDEPGRAAVVADWLNRLPFVRWDRLVVEPCVSVPAEEKVSVYGWIDRPDDRADFVLVRFALHDYTGATPISWFDFVTSSAEHSGAIHRLLMDGGDEPHEGCERVEKTLLGFVANAISRERG